MNGLEAYRFYMAVKTHFTNKNYDVFVNKGRFSNISEEAFLAKKNHKFFIGLSRKFEFSKDYIQFLVAASAYGKTEDIFDPIISFNHYQEWIKNKQKTTQVILDDISSMPTIMSRIQGDPPVIVKDVISGKIHIETAVAINRVNPFIKEAWFDKKYLIIGEMCLKIKKLDRFVKFNEQSVSEHLKDV